LPQGHGHGNILSSVVETELGHEPSGGMVTERA
jgi:hypothetical protein